MSVQIGLDVGGTFTDCVAITSEGRVVLEKAPTTPSDQSDGVIDGLDRLAQALGYAGRSALLADTARIVHGTTTADNTMIQMNGARTGLLVTEGFRDEIEFRRCYKEDIWDPALAAPIPIARRRVRLEVRERLNAEGEVETPLDELHLRGLIRRLERFDVTSIAVALLHSYRNPTHELRVREIIAEEFADVALVSLSHEVLPKPPEFERTSTTLVNAYVGPPIVDYLATLEARLRDDGYAAELLIATCSGGVATTRSIARRAVATLNSGPTGGVVAAARAAHAAGLGDVVSIDMGGTSYDVCLIRNGRPELKRDWNWRHRYCIALPMVDIHAIGAGGGSIARATSGRLTVGPESAGARPGPACYGRGGTDPTVTDANVVLGRIDPAAFWSGRLALDVDAAWAAVARLGAQLGLALDDTTEVAASIVRLVEAHMNDALRRVLSLAGADPRRFDLVAFGGMGGLHACAQATALGMQRVLVPSLASGFSALGLLQADHVVDRTRTTIAPWQTLDAVALDQLGRDLHAEVTAELDDAGVPIESRDEEWYLNLVYPGQTFDTSIPFARVRNEPIGAHHIEAAVTEFHRRNVEARLIETHAQEPVVRGVRLVATGRVGHRGAFVAPPSPTRTPSSSRRVWIDNAWRDALIVDARTMAPGDRMIGPAVASSDFTSVVIGPHDELVIAEHGDALIDVGVNEGGRAPAPR
jgi:N-methylhydantoinase A